MINYLAIECVYGISLTLILLLEIRAIDFSYALSLDFSLVKLLIYAIIYSFKNKVSAVFGVKKEYRLGN